MNFINCSNTIKPIEISEAIAFWSQNSFEHIKTLLNFTKGTTAKLNESFVKELENLYTDFKTVNEIYKQNSGKIPQQSAFFFKTNKRFIDLLERIKYEAVSGYPVLQQTVFHYLYEQRYINAVFGMINPRSNVLISTEFSPFSNNLRSCIYNQIYFWSIIGSIHPSSLMESNAFYNSINAYSREYLTKITNGFNQINFSLSSIKKSPQKHALESIFEDFCTLNKTILDFLLSIRQGSPKIFVSSDNIHLPLSFYEKLQHMINEHTLVEKLNENIKKRLL